MKATDQQIGGDHYKGCGIQPIEYIHANKLDFIQGCVVKYITRFREKNGLEDLEKIKHYIDLLIQLEYTEEDKEQEVVFRGDGLINCPIGNYRVTWKDGFSEACLIFRANGIKQMRTFNGGSPTVRPYNPFEIESLTLIEK